MIAGERSLKMDSNLVVAVTAAVALMSMSEMDFLVHCYCNFVFVDCYLLKWISLVLRLVQICYFVLFVEISNFAIEVEFVSA